MHRLMQKASTSKKMFDYFMMLSQEVLHNPNSQLRDDERYIPVLEAAIASELLDEYEKMPLVHDLQMAMQNRVGRVANDFSYTLASGRSGRMGAIQSDYTLLFFSNPGCPMCRDIKEQIIQSPKLSDMIARKELAVLVVYPDEDLQAWQEHLEDYPESYAYACVIRYNTPPYTVPERGCAIFFHCAKGPTEGCIGLPEADFLRMLLWLDAEEMPYVLIVGSED